MSFISEVRARQLNLLYADAQLAPARAVAARAHRRQGMILADDGGIRLGRLIGGKRCSYAPAYLDSRRRGGPTLKAGFAAVSALQFPSQPDPTQMGIASDQHGQFGTRVAPHPTVTAQPHGLIACKVSARVGLTGVR